MTPPGRLRRQRLAATSALAVVLGGAALAALAAPEPGGSARAGTASPPARVAATPPPLETVEIVATGDLTIGRPGIQPPGGAGALLAGVRAHLRGDVVLGNLETVLGGAGPGGCAADSVTCFSFTGTSEDAGALRRAGFTVLNLANNHANDFGEVGRQTTEAALARAGLRWTGRPGQITIVRAGGVRVAVLGFAPYGWAEDLLDVDAAQALVRKAAASADVVVVTMHAGGEGADAARVRPGPETYLGEPRGDPVRFAHAVVDAGADLVAGHGPHVVRAIEWYRGRPIAYSLGNLSAYRTLNTAGDGGVGAILRVTIAADGTVRAASTVPLDLRDGTPALDPSGEALALLRERSLRDLGKRASDVGDDGTIRPPPL